MKSAWQLALLVPAICSLTQAAPLQLIAPARPAEVFSGPGRRIDLTWRNPSAEPVDVRLSYRLYQASSATAAPWGEFEWKRLQMLPGQTVLESAAIDFPEVRAGTRFLVQWIAATNSVVGMSDITVYPTNLLQELKTLAGTGGIGVLDPANILKPLLKQNGVEFLDLEQDANYAGTLVIAGPYVNKGQVSQNLAKRLQEFARKGVAVVWIQPPAPADAPEERLRPSFYIAGGPGALLVATASIMSNLSTRPESQRNLVELCRLALHREALPLPQTE